MPPFLALTVVSIFTAWLIWRDGKERGSVTAATWIVVSWALILSSRPVTSWFTGDFGAAATRDEGNPQEAAFYIGLQLAGLIVLLRRGVRLPLVIKDNRWLFAFYLFWAASVLWSDYPVITIKRLIKDLGNVIMILILLTERTPVQALRAVFTRVAYVGIPLSIVLIRYFPELGRAYAGYDRSELMYVGVALHKNTLGTLALVSSLFLLWDVMESRRYARTAMEKATLASRVLVLAMCWYLLLRIDSATSLVCALLAASILTAFRFPALKRRTRRLEPYALTVLFLSLFLDWGFNLKELIVSALGRDMTFTTRTDIWPIVLRHAENWLVGAGFNTFWAGSRLVQLYQYDGIDGIAQAHSGYLETYLNGGWIGVGLLTIVLLVAYRRTLRELALDAPESLVRFIVLLVALLYNFSEASFNKVSLVWLVTLFAVMRYGQRSSPPAPATKRSAPGVDIPRRSVLTGAPFPSQLRDGDASAVLPGQRSAW
jgi:exopolysaccharide production protein ExoQ